MGRNALVLHLLILFLACIESNCDCSAKTNFTVWKCSRDDDWPGVVDDSSRFPNCDLKFTLTIDPLNATRWKVNMSALFGPLPWEITLVDARQTAESDILQWKSLWQYAIYSTPLNSGLVEKINGTLWKIVQYEINENKDLMSIFNNSHLTYKINHTDDLILNGSYPTLSLFWSRLNEKIDACSAASVMASTDSDAQIENSTVEIEQITSPILTTILVSATNPALISTTGQPVVSPTTASALAATKDAVVALPTMIATSFVLSLIIVALIIVVIVLLIKLRRARKVENTRRPLSSQPMSSSAPMSSTMELDRNSEKQETWDNRKERERREQKIPEIPSIRDDVEKPPKKVRPKYIKTKTMTMTSFD